MGPLVMSHSLKTGGIISVEHKILSLCVMPLVGLHRVTRLWDEPERWKHLFDNQIPDYLML